MVSFCSIFVRNLLARSIAIVNTFIKKRYTEDALHKEMKANILKEVIHAAYYFKFPVSSISPANRKSHFENSQPQRLPFEIIIRKIRPRAVAQLDPYALAQSTQDS